MSRVRDRIVELRRVPARQLQPHPRQWRRHPPEQRRTLAALLGEIGYAGALVARELANGSLQLIDGHLRAETTADQTVPVLVVDLDDNEARLLLAALHPIAEMGQAEKEKLAELVGQLQTSDPSLRAMFDQLAGRESEQPSIESKESPVLETSFQVLVQCASEAEQRDVYERLTADGLKCRLLTM